MREKKVFDIHTCIIIKSISNSNTLKSAYKVKII